MSKWPMDPIDAMYRIHWSAWKRVPTILPRRINGRWRWFGYHYVRYGGWLLMPPMMGALVERTLVPPSKVDNVLPFRRPA